MEEETSASTGFMKKVIICIIGLIVVAALVVAVFAKPSSGDEIPVEEVAPVANAEQNPF